MLNENIIIIIIIIIINHKGLVKPDNTKSDYIDENN